MGKEGCDNHYEDARHPSSQRGLWARDQPVFERIGDGPARVPLLLSVPHAGRAYASALLRRSRVPFALLQQMEDRYADALIQDAVMQGHVAYVAHVPRAVLDLNRHPRDIDPHMVRDIPYGVTLVRSAKQRGGLGLFPRSLTRCGNLWREAMRWEEALDRIEALHTPYHAALEQEMAEIAECFGQAVLLDVHSMPPLSPGMGGGPRPDIVIGDRHGASASGYLVETVCRAAKAHGLVVAHNQPYAGSYLIERHGRPIQGRHAIQVEVSRDLYLDETMQEPGPGLAPLRRALADMVEAVVRELPRGRWAEAAE